MSTSYELYYFNYRGFAEPIPWIRIIFAQAGVEYRDIRTEQWEKECKESKMG